jgi:hypothetical protein
MIKADGPAFERRFKATMKDVYYVKRLRTLRTGYAGLTQPADFILTGDSFNYVELKETASDRLSISTLQQYSEIKEFLEHKARLSILKRKCQMNYWLVVHFIGQGVVAIANEDILKYGESKKTLRYDSPEAVRVVKLEDLIKENIF